MTGSPSLDFALRSTDHIMLSPTKLKVQWFVPCRRMPSRHVFIWRFFQSSWHFMTMLNSFRWRIYLSLKTMPAVFRAVRILRHW